MGTLRVGRSELVLALFLMAIVGMMIVPLPTALLDVLIASNLAVSLLVLLVSVTVRNPAAFSAMPTLLLVTTLYRLSLNVSSTRLILLQADAGEVIRAFGEFVVRGDYVVGAVVFAVLTLIQYVVVARGAERIAEVGARFSLDAMPGKQMAIDADVRAGVLEPRAAQARRAELERESHLYGAMDGAMRFVKGDVIAGIVITLVNVVAGVGIGAGMRGLAIGEALRTYGLLTIGDGLVSQIPSLLTAAGAGIVVTRVASRDDASSLAGDLGEQLFGDPRVLAAGAAFSLVLALVPGLPLLPFAFVGFLLAVGAWAARDAGHRPTAAPAIGAARTTPAPVPIAIELGAEVAQAIAPTAGKGALPEALAALGARIEAELGLALPAVRVHGSAARPARGYAILWFEVPLVRGEVGDASRGAAPIAAALDALVRRNAHELIGVDEAQRMLDRLAEHEPRLVHGLVPAIVSLERLTQVLQRLLAEGVSIRPLGRILDAVAAHAAAHPDAATLAELVRTALARQITFAHAHDGVLAVHPLDPMLEDGVRDALQKGAGGTYLAMQPDEARELVTAARTIVRDAERPAAVLVTQPDVRRFVSEVLRPELPELAVLAYSEIAPEVEVEQRAPLRLGQRAAAE